MPNFDETRKTASGDARLMITTTGGDITSCSFKSLGKRSIGYSDQDELIFFPSNLEIELYDPLGDGVTRFNYNSDPVELQINSIAKFVGNVDPLSVDHDFRTKLTKIMVVDNCSNLKNLRIKDNGGNALNPLGYTNGNMMNVQLLVKEIFKQINPSVTLIVNQDWKFKRWPDHGGNVHNFDEIYIPVSGQFYPNYHYDTVIDLLKGLAQNFGCITGMSDKNNAYFVKRWKSSLSGIFLTTVEGLKIINYLPKLDGIRGNELAPTVAHYDAGTVETYTSGEFKYPDKVLQVDIYIGSDNYDTNILVANDGSKVKELAWSYSVPIGDTKDSAIDETYRGLRGTIAEYHYNYRKYYRQRFEIDLTGTDYSMIELYRYGQWYLRPSKLEIEDEKNTTKLYALEIGS
jgi:hypothetical protein